MLMALASSPMLPLAAGMGPPQVRADETAKTIETKLNAVTQLNMVGSYGNWLANQVLGDQPGKLSLRSGNWNDIDAWRTAARKRAWECIAPVDPGKTPEVRVDSVAQNIAARLLRPMQTAAIRLSKGSLTVLKMLFDSRACLVCDF